MPWIFFILASLQPALQRYVLVARRRKSLERIRRTLGATVITLIHRQESMGFLRFPIVRYIDIDDAESILLRNPTELHGTGRTCLAMKGSPV